MLLRGSSSSRVVVFGSFCEDSSISYQILAFIGTKNFRLTKLLQSILKSRGIEKNNRIRTNSLAGL